MKLNRIAVIATVLLALSSFTSPAPVDAVVRANVEAASPLPTVVCPDGSKPSDACIEQYRKVRNKKIHKANTELAKKVKKATEDKEARIAALSDTNNTDLIRKITNDFTVAILDAIDDHDSAVGSADRVYVFKVLLHCCDQQPAVRWAPAPATFDEAADELAALIAEYPYPDVVCPGGGALDPDCVEAYKTMRNNKIRNANTKLAKKIKELGVWLKARMAANASGPQAQTSATILASFGHQVGQANDAHSATVKAANDSYTASLLQDCCDSDL